MADITMCRNETCPLKASCYRKTAKANPYYQAYALFKPDAEGNCEYYWLDRSIERLRKIASAAKNLVENSYTPSCDGDRQRWLMLKAAIDEAGEG